MNKETLELMAVRVTREREFLQEPSPRTAGQYVEAIYAHRGRQLNMEAAFSLIFMAVLLLAVVITYFVGVLDPFYGALAAIIGIGVAAHYTGRRSGAADAFEEIRKEFR